MSFAYRLKVHAPDGTLRDTFTPTDELGELAQFDVDALGVCGDAAFSILPEHVEINPRDIVLLEVSADNFATAGTALYLGMAVETPNPRSYELGTVRCVGLKQRFYEIAVQAYSISGGDVATMLAAGENSLPGLPALVTFSNADAPTLGFQLGDRYPKFESFGDFADALAATVGAFVVPTGGSYSYDGESFAAGDSVPPVQWGVRADGKLVFRRSIAAALVIDEDDVDVQIEWSSVQAEEAVNSVDVVYASAYDLDLFNVAFFNATGTGGLGEQFAPNPFPIIRRFDAAGVTNATRATRRVEAPEPLTLMTQTPLLGYDTDGDTWTNPSNALDNNPATFGEFLGSSGIGSYWKVMDQTASGPTTGVGDGLDQGIAVIKYAATEDVQFTVDLITGAAGVRELRGVLPSTVDLSEPRTVGLLIAQPQEGAGTPNPPWGFVSTLTMVTLGDLRLYLVQGFAPDVDIGTATRDRQFAEAFYTRIAASASVVRVVGVGNVGHLADVTPLVGSQFVAPIERITYSITTSRGVETTYHVDQAFPAGEESQRVLLERLARRAVAEGGARR